MLKRYLERSGFILVGLVLLLSLFSINQPQKVQATSSFTGYTYVRKISILNATIPETLTNFVVLLQLNSTNFNFSRCQSSGADIRFADSNFNSLNYEIEQWNSVSQLATVWIQVPSISASVNTSYFWFYYDNPTATDGQTYSYGVSNVWSSSHLFVGHMDDYVDTSHIYDSMQSTMGSIAKNGAANPPTIAGQVGNGQSFTATSSQYIPVTWNYGILQRYDLTPYTITGNIYQAMLLPNGNILYAVARGSAGHTGIGEVNPKTGVAVFQYNSPTDTVTTDGPESVYKYSNGDYLTADGDGGGYVYELNPAGTRVWSYNTSGTEIYCRPVTLTTTDDSVMVINMSANSLTLISRANQSVLWTMTGFNRPNDVATRVISGNLTIALAEYGANDIQVINYGTKVTSYTYSGLGTHIYNLEWTDDTHILFTEGSTGLCKIITVGTGVATYTSTNQIGGTTIGVRLVGSTEAIVANGSSIVKVIGITASPGTSMPQLTLTALVKPIGSISTYNSIIANSSPTAATGIYLGLRTSGANNVVVFGVGNGSTDQYLQGNTSLIVGNWYLIQATIGVDNTMRIYINGTADTATLSSTAITPYQSNSFNIGAYYNGASDYFNGIIDEVRISTSSVDANWAAAENLNMLGTYINIGTETLVSYPVDSSRSIFWALIPLEVAAIAIFVGIIRIRANGSVKALAITASMLIFAIISFLIIYNLLTII
jgi:hypothetical protein